MDKLPKPPAPAIEAQSVSTDILSRAEWIECTRKADSRAREMCELGQDTGRVIGCNSGCRCASINTAEQLPCDRTV